MTKDKNIFILNIYFMLTYAFRELKQNNYEEIAGEDFDNIQQLFAEILIKGISCQLKQGILKQYIIRKDSLPTLRGKLDLNATIQNKLCRKQEIGCEYDELSENNIFNQIIKATVFGQVNAPFSCSAAFLPKAARSIPPFHSSGICTMPD